MRFSSYLSTALTAIGLITLSAQGATITYDGGSPGDWNLNTNWSGDVLPGLGDDVVIPTGKIVNVTSSVLTNDAEANSLTVQGTGQIVVGDNTLQVDGGANSTIASASGILLDDLDSTFNLSASQTFSGAGSIELAHQGAMMQLPSGAAVTFDVIVEGYGSIVPASGTATFINQEVVTANSASGFLELASGLILDDIASAAWKAESGGELQFKRAHTVASSLEGDLFLSGNDSKVTLFGVSMNFDSTFTWTQGTSSDPSVLFLDMSNNNITFSYDDFEGTSSCNPDPVPPHSISTSGSDLILNCPSS